MTENQLFYGIIGTYFAIVAPLVAGLFWLQYKKWKQQEATATRLKEGENREKLYARVDSTYREEMERRAGCYEEPYEED